MSSNWKDLCEQSINKLLVTDQLITCAPGDSIQKVVQIMSEKNIGCIIVTENQKAVGIFTERDLMRKVVLKIDNLNTTPISSVMTPNPVSVFPETSLYKVMAAMRLGRFRHLVVVNEQKQSIGVISIKDVLTCLTDVISGVTKL